MAFNKRKVFLQPIRSRAPIREQRAVASLDAGGGQRRQALSSLSLKVEGKRVGVCCGEYILADWTSISVMHYAYSRSYLIHEPCANT